MKTMLAVFLLMFSLSAFADYVTTDGLTEQQKAEIQLQVAKLKASGSVDSQSVSASVRQEAEAWGNMGANVVRAAVGGAKELGIAANEFANTPLGKVTVAVVVYKLLGEDLLGAVVGSTVMLILFSLATYIIIKFRWGAKITYEYKPKFWGLYQKRYIVSVSESEDATLGRVIVGCLIIAIGLIVGLNTIF